MKRLFDISLSFIGLLFMLPFFAVVALLIKNETSGNVLFIQKRIGQHHRPFYLYKFRTMINDAHTKGLHITAGNDPRITKVGRILRKTKIDELPQLLNILKGDMSFVGPRPEVECYVSKFRDDYNDILKIKPGITDIASLIYSDEESILESMKNPEEYYVQVLLPRKILLAKEYIQKASLGYDVRIIFLTVMKLICPKSFSWVSVR